MKTKILNKITVFFLMQLGFFVLGQEFTNFGNIEQLFKLPQNKVEEVVIGEGYTLKSKDLKSGGTTYIKKNSTHTFVVNLIFKAGKLEYIGWNDSVMGGKFIVEDIGKDSSYKIDEKKTDDYLGVFTSVSNEKGFQITIFKTIQNLNKGMISFSLMKLKDRTEKESSSILQKTSKNTSLFFLSKYKGEYPSDVKLLNNTILKNRLIQLIGKERYQYMNQTWAVEGGIGVKNNMFDASGCEQHNCDMTNFMIVVDLKKDILYMGYRVEGEIKKFGEKDDFPEQLLQWEQENIENNNEEFSN
ncbi:hypothetical protein [uncultured Chryseobacterium sp.]|uniref:hypothetical protein n=1 Tax=uncultured Chryseobacterium sp. TaxID=259322 RepID=UPI002583D8D0|nr:hypothetical protein [uncultured Chryseobacterium sp.]